MTSVKLTQMHSWKVAVTRTEGDDWPNVDRRYASQVIRPVRVVVSFSQRGGESVEVGAVSVSGPRVLKGDRLGAVIEERYYAPPDLEWIAAIVRDIFPARIALEG